MEFEQIVQNLSFCFAIFQVSDFRIIYANKKTTDTFGIKNYLFEEISVWQLLDPRLIIADLKTEKIERNSENIEVVSETFASFQKYKSTERFTGWVQLDDIVEDDGSVKYRSAIVFIDNYQNVEHHFKEFLKLERAVAERDLSGLFAHRLNNVVAKLETVVEAMSTNSNFQSKERLTEPLTQLKKLGFDAKTFAELRHELPNMPARNLNNVAAVPASTVSAIETKSTKVLVVDDEIELAKGLCLIFKNFNIDAVWATSKTQAILLAQTFQPDSALIDVILGHDDGYETANSLLQLIPELKILMMTGYSGVVANLNSLNFPVVSKPFDFPKVVQILKDINK